MTRIITSKIPCLSLKEIINWAHSLELTIEDQLYIIEHNVGFKPAVLVQDFHKTFDSNGDDVSLDTLIQHTYGSPFSDYEIVNLELNKLYKVQFAEFTAELYLSPIQHLDFVRKNLLCFNASILDNGLTLTIEGENYNFSMPSHVHKHTGTIGGYYVNVLKESMVKNLNEFGLLIGGKSNLSEHEVWPDYFEIPANILTKAFKKES